MDDEIKKSAKEGEDYLLKWLENLGKASDVAPIIRQAHEIKKWENEVISSAPDEADEIPHTQIKKAFDQENEYWKTVLPPIPEYDKSDLLLSAPSSSPTGTVIYDFVRRSGDLDVPSLKDWSVEQSERYEAIQKSNKRRETVRNYLHELKPKLAKEFDQAVVSYEAAVGGWQDRESAGIALRNVLEHYKGELLERAIQRPAEQKIKWTIMADRLSVSAIGSFPHQQLVEQGETWRRLHQRLTDVAKGLQTGAATDLTTIFTEFLDHLYVVLSLSKI